MSFEIWHKIPGYEGRYSMSSDDRIRSNRRTLKYKTGYKRDVEDRILSTRKNNRNIPMVDLYLRSDEGGLKKVTRSLNVLRCSIPQLRDNEL